MLRLSFFCVAACLSLSGCAKAVFYSDDALTKTTGMRIYTPKPYLLVTRNAAKEKPLEASIVYLPDASQPQYVKYRPGIGSNKFTVALTNGMLTSYGMESDAKIAELVTAVGGLATVGGGLAKSLADAASVREATAKSRESREEAADRAVLNSAASQLQAIATRIQKGQPANLSQQAKTSVSSLADNLNATSEKLKAPLAVDANTLDDIIKSLENSVINQWDGVVAEVAKTATANSYQKTLVTQKTEVQKVLATLKQELTNALKPDATATAPSFNLYEIHQIGNTVTLVEVK